MKLLEALSEEHRLIERVAGSFLAFAHRRAHGEPLDADGEAFLRFFRSYAGAFHHGREEEILFTTLAEESGLPRASGPLGALEKQHREMEAMLWRVEELLGRSHPAVLAAELPEAVRGYVHALWQHIDAEDSVLIPESDQRLRRSGVHQLPDRPAGPEELAARADGERLAGTYAPVDDGAVRGEGCAICPSYGVTCDGVEREWWSDAEWEDFMRRSD